MICKYDPVDMASIIQLIFPIISWLKGEHLAIEPMQIIYYMQGRELDKVSVSKFQAWGGDVNENLISLKLFPFILQKQNIVN